MISKNSSATYNGIVRVTAARNRRGLDGRSHPPKKNGACGRDLGDAAGVRSIDGADRADEGYGKKQQQHVDANERAAELHEGWHNYIRHDLLICHGCIDPDERAAELHEGWHNYIGHDLLICHSYIDPDERAAELHEGWHNYIDHD